MHPCLSLSAFALTFFSLAMVTTGCKATAGHTALLDAAAPGAKTLATATYTSADGRATTLTLKTSSDGSTESLSYTVRVLDQIDPITHLSGPATTVNMSWSDRIQDKVVYCANAFGAPGGQGTAISYSSPVDSATSEAQLQAIKNAGSRLEEVLTLLDTMTSDAATNAPNPTAASVADTATAMLHDFAANLKKVIAPAVASANIVREQRTEATSPSSDADRRDGASSAPPDPAVDGAQSLGRSDDSGHIR